MAKLQEHGIGAGVVHMPNHHYDCFKTSLTPLPNVDAFSNRQISLPVGWWLTEQDAQFIATKTVEVVKGFM